MESWSVLYGGSYCVTHKNIENIPHGLWTQGLFSIGCPYKDPHKKWTWGPYSI